MIVPLKLKFPVVICTLLIAAVSIPQAVSAQRFSHSMGGGGGMSHSAPAISRPAASPSFNRPAELPQSRSINGGSQNFGNHNFNRNVTVNAAPRVVERPGMNVHRNMVVHENVNVYHSGIVAYHPYSYHPYHPYHWGPLWHPLGFFAATLAADAFYFSIANQPYYYYGGVYYQPVAGGYNVVSAPIGAIVGSLPNGYETVQLGNDYFYYYGGTFYVGVDQGFQVVVAPIGAVVNDIPEGAVQQNINGETYLMYNNTYYEPVSENGEDAYQVVPVN